MKKLISFLVALLFLGCQDIRTEYSVVLHEEATVADYIFSPSTHDTKVTMSAMDMGLLGSVDYSGNKGIGLGNGLQLTKVDVPERFGILFRCQHGSFTSEGSDARHRELYNRLKDHKGEKVDVTYKEVCTAIYEVDSEKKGKLISRTLIQYDFLDAELLKEQRP